MEKGPEKKSLFSRELKTNLRIMRHAGVDDVASEENGRMEDMYGFYDSPLSSYDEYFQDVLGKAKTIKSFIENTYPEKKGELVGIELGGPGSKLFRGLRHEFKRSAGFTLTDNRGASEKENDSRRKHDVVAADVFFRNGAQGRSFSEVERWVQENGKADLVIERMVGGLHMIRRREIFEQILKRWFTLVSDRGTLLIELPNKMPAAQLTGMKLGLEKFAVENDCEHALDMDSNRVVKVARFTRREAKK